MRTSLLRRAAVALAALLVGAPIWATARAEDGLKPGEAFLTQFSGTTIYVDDVNVIDEDGVVGRVVDVTAPGDAPVGARLDAQSRPMTKAGEVGQVFGVAIGKGDPPSIYLTATSAFGLHRNADNTGWMPGMWGKDGGPGTVYVLNSENSFEPSILSDVTLDGRANSGAGLGNIAYDRWNDQLFVSDLESGMIHRLRASDGSDLGHYDHGVTARKSFYDVPADGSATLPSVAFDPASTARINDCPSGDFSRTPSCWNFADFRRRIWGLGVRRDALTKEVRLYYSVWGSQGFGSPDYPTAGDDQRNSVWSVKIGDDGDFDTSDIRREFFLPDFFRAPESIARAGRSNPVADIAFAGSGDQTVMLLAERGGIRNLGLAGENAFAYPHEARVLRYELDENDVWQPIGRYDVGHYDRKDDGPPYERADASGGVSFGLGYGDDWSADSTKGDSFAWMTGDALCSPAAPCFDAAEDKHSDTSYVDGLQGGEAGTFEPVEPDAAFKPYPAPGPAYPASGPDASYMIDADGDYGRNDATRIGDVEVYQPGTPGSLEEMLAEGGGYGPPPYVPPYDPGWDPAPPPPDDDWWDPPPIILDTDLAVEKEGPATCQAGVDCAYTLRLKNVGVVPYIGQLALSDTMPAGATLTTASPGWNCLVAAPDVSCVTLGFAILLPGGTATLHLDIRLPNPVVGPSVENCVEIDWSEMGTSDNDGSDDSDCVDTPVTPGFDLGIDKTAPPNCVEGADCFYVIKVTNYGPGIFNGTVAISDVLPPGVTFTAGSSCSASAGGFTCAHGGVTLGVGASDFFMVAAKLPTGIAGTSIENCSDIDWAHMGADDGAPDAHADNDCVSVNVLPLTGFFDLTITKAGPAHCDAGGDCVYDLVIKNNGPDDFAGGMALHDKMPAGAVFVGFTSTDPWICLAAPPDVNCAIIGPLLMHPGDSFSGSLKIKLPNPIPGGATSVQNCADLPWSTGGLPADDNPAPPFDAQDSQCVDTPIGAGFDLQISKTGPSECYEGHVCDYEITVKNGGAAPFTGLVAVTDTLPAGSTVDTTSGALTCAGLSAGTNSCAVAFGPLAPAATVSYHLKVKLPDPVPGIDVENCVSMDWSDPFPVFGAPIYTGDDNAGNDGPACVTTPILAADLAPFGGTVCEKGATCTLNVSIDNRGGHLFRGAAGLRGMLNPAVKISSIESMTDGLSCEVTGSGAYQCNADQLVLEAGASAKLQVMIDIPADFKEKRIVHQKEMLWPDAAVKDEKPEDDRHVSIIHIAQPEEVAPPEPTCTGGEMVDGKCVCLEGSVAKKDGDKGFVCIKPPLVCEDGVVRGGKCICPEGSDRQQTGENAFKCIAPPPPEIICDGGRVRNGQCRCPEGTERHQTGEHSYECVKPPPEIICEGGRVRNGTCRCPEGTERNQTGENAYECVKPPPEIVCDGGRVRNGSCRCPEGTERQQTGESAFRCVAPQQPEISCEGGRVRRGECVCPEGAERRPLLDNAYRCVVPDRTEVTCEGGRVRNGRCLCPEGTSRERTGDNAFQCVASQQQPEISCEGGRVRRGQCVCPEGSERKQVSENAYQCSTPQRPEITCEGGRVRGGRCNCPRGKEMTQTGDNSFACVGGQQGGDVQPTETPEQTPRIRRLHRN